MTLSDMFVSTEGMFVSTEGMFVSTEGMFVSIETVEVESMKTRWMDHDAPSNNDIRDEILRLLMCLKKGESICPSDAARAFGSKWRQHMPLVREVAADMVRDGMIEVVQRDEVVDIDERDIESIKGPIRLRLIPKSKVTDVDDSDSNE